MILLCRFFGNRPKPEHIVYKPDSRAHVCIFASCTRVHISLLRHPIRDLAVRAFVSASVSVTQAKAEYLASTLPRSENL